MWDQVLRSFKDMLDKAEQSYLSKATSAFRSSLVLSAKRLLTLYPAFNCTEEENATALATVRKRAWTALCGKVGEQTADPAILTKLRTHFEERFRYDDNGVPRVWKPEDDIDGAFQKARDEVSAVTCRANDSERLTLRCSDCRSHPAVRTYRAYRRIACVLTPI